MLHEVLIARVSVLYRDFRVKTNLGAGFFKQLKHKIFISSIQTGYRYKQRVFLMMAKTRDSLEDCARLCSSYKAEIKIYISDER